MKIIKTGLLVILLLGLFSITSLAETPVYQSDGSCSFKVGMTVEGKFAGKEDVEFSVTGKFQSGSERMAKEGDEWYGTSDVVFENMEIYTDSFEYIKKNRETGNVISQGTITPNTYGWFSFKLKHNESIEFTVEKKGNMNFYMYQTPNDEYTTKSVFNGKEYTGTTNVKTGETIGVGAIPGGMETRYYEAYVLGAGKEYAPKLYAISGDADIEYINTPKNLPTYAVTYSFVSNTEGKELPTEVTGLLPAEETGIEYGTEVSPVQPQTTTVTVSGGRWTFDGYTPSSVTIEDADVNFEGRWTYQEDIVEEENAKESSKTKTVRQSISAKSTRKDDTEKENVEEAEQEVRIENEKMEEPYVYEETEAMQKDYGVDCRGVADAVHAFNKMIVVLAGLSIFLIVLLVRIAQDAYVLLWYAKKKKRNKEKEWM